MPTILLAAEKWQCITSRGVDQRKGWHAEGICIISEGAAVEARTGAKIEARKLAHMRRVIHPERCNVPGCSVEGLTLIDSIGRIRVVAAGDGIGQKAVCG